MKIGVVAASSRFPRDLADRLLAQVAARRDGIEVVVHPDSFLEHGHFAGEDAVRARAVLDFANDPGIDAVWFGRGGYGACRIAETVMAGVTPAARDKIYLGYSDAGSLLAGLYRMGFPHLAHGPMVGDLNREGGTAAIDRALDWLTTGTGSALEAGLDDRPTVAFNITILSALLGTALEPDLSGHVVLLEDVSEPLYRLDRTLFHITSQPSMRRIAGFRLGRVSDIVSNDPDFGQTPEQIMLDWCARSGIPFLGQADIGHDADNKIVPFGRGGVAERPR
ncbi:LD-carboxypeptidase [Brevundimonas sp.]|uniref:LD-carboxypeptidase n=1 Tax=Brevundimonas sp. TaxID=1871086 RepID=UPI002AB9ECCF|nr:LD-carboxypeptidase [Brevundimonas sp.]MDZ4365397.1 LD-carboxypeptidase [Brevundimonas sp.]